MGAENVGSTELFLNVYFSSLFILPSSPNQNFGNTEFSINTKLLPPLQHVHLNKTLYIALLHAPINITLKGFIIKDNRQRM